MRGFIYKITNLINNKIYIGSTKIEVHHRFRKHISDYYTKYLKDNSARTCIKLCNAFYEYGLECFIVEEIDMIIIKNTKELNDIENKYIIQYNSIEKGYNSQYAKRTKKESDKAYYEKIKNNPDFKDKRHKLYLKYKNNKDYKERMRKNNKIHYQKNKDKINAYKKEKIICECGSIVSRRGIAEHKRTKKHLNYIKK